MKVNLETFQLYNSQHTETQQQIFLLRIDAYWCRIVGVDLGHACVSNSYGRYYLVLCFNI